MTEGRPGAREAQQQPSGGLDTATLDLPGLDARLLRQGPRPLRTGGRVRPRAVRPGLRPGGGERPHQRLRPRAGQRDPGQGPHPDPAEPVVVRPAGRRAPRPGLHGGGRGSRRRRGPGHDLQEAGHVPGRMHCPRLPHRLRPPGVPAVRAPCAASRCRRAWWTAPGWSRPSSRRRPRPRWASTTRTSPTTPSWPWWATTSPRA